MRCGLLPIKPFSMAKSRLATWLAPPDHEAVVRALCQDALDLVAADRDLDWWVVTDDAAIKQMARARGLATMVDGGVGLNRALAHASKKVQRLGFRSVFILPCDLPLASTTDLRKVSLVGEDSDVVVVAAERSGGTNGLLMSPPGVLQARFGPDSLRAHVDAAQRRGLSCSVLIQPRLGLDLDTVGEVRELLERAEATTHHGRTQAVLARLWDSGTTVDLVTCERSSEP